MGVSLAVLAVLAGGVSDASALIDRIPLEIHLAALGCVVLSLIVRAIRLAHIARSCGRRVRIRTGARAHLWAEALAAVTPARTGGDPARVWVLHRDGVPPVSGAALVAGEVVGDLVVVITLSLTLAVLSPAVRVVSLLAAAFAGVIVLALLIASAFRRRTADGRMPRTLARLGVSRRRWRGVRLQALKFRRTLRLVRRAPLPAQLFTMTLSILNVGSRLAILPLLALPLAADYSLLRLVAWPLLFLYPGAALPFPGGGGVIEMGFAAGLAPDFGAESLAVALVWWRFYTHHLVAGAGAAAIGVSALRRRARTRVAPRAATRPDRARSCIAAGCAGLFAALPLAAQTRGGTIAVADTAPPADMLAVGEKMEFGVQFGPVRLGRSEMTVAARESLSGMEVYRLELEFRAPIPFFAIHDRQTSWVVPAPLRSVRFDRFIQEGRKRTSSRYHLDAADRRLRVEPLDDERADPGETTASDPPPDLILPEAPLDDLAILYEMRRRIAAGETSFVIDRYYQGADRAAEFELERRDRTRVPAGRFEVFVLRAVIPGMSMFTPESDARIHIGVDPPHPLVMVTTGTRHGRLTMYLRDFRPGDAAAGSP